MDNIAEKVQTLNRLIEQGQILEAFEKYYHEGVVMQENEEAPVIGKASNREREKDFVQNLQRFQAKLLKSAQAENFVFSEWEYNYDHQQWGAKNYKQVSVQEWKDGQVIREKFYYSN